MLHEAEDTKKSLWCQSVIRTQGLEVVASLEPDPMFDTNKKALIAAYSTHYIAQEAQAKLQNMQMGDIYLSESWP